jgi:uridylate kinase
MKEKEIVIGLGGSIMVPDEVNVSFLKKFNFLIKKQIKKGFKFVIIVGGGRTARKYQKAVSEVIKVSDKEKDNIGISATKLNAYLIKVIFEKQAFPKIFDKRFKIKEFGKYPLIIGSGWEYGCSTDLVACQVAYDFNIKKIIMLGNPDYVYTSDFQKHKDAKPIEMMSWSDYLKLIPSKWSPGLSSPVDPVAAHLAKKKNLQVIVAGGKDLDNFEKILNNKKFKGTVIEG